MAVWITKNVFGGIFLVIQAQRRAFFPEEGSVAKTTLINCCPFGSPYTGTYQYSCEH